jgi:hypothetical protein
MKARAILASSAIIISSFVPVLNSTAWAAVTILDPTPDPQGPSAATLAAMEDQCDAKAVAHGAAWSGDLDEASIVPTLISGPTEVGTHTIADAIGDPVGAGTFTPGTVSILGDPYRIGGSVNMFGVQQSTGGHYSASTYDFRADFTTTFSFAFNCKMSETVNVPAEGIYVIAGDFGDSEDAVRGNCAAFTAQGDNDPRPDWWGEPFHGGNPDNPHCKFEGTAAHEEEQDRDDEAGTAIEETQTDNLLAHEDAGEGFDIGDTVLIGQTVICISPTTGPQTKKGVPGTWVAKNGYTGGKCTTAWFNVAPWGAGSQDSNGTYISVPLS